VVLGAVITKGKTPFSVYSLKLSPVRRG